jgi:hypothetical protein
VSCGARVLGILQEVQKPAISAKLGSRFDEEALMKTILAVFLLSTASLAFAHNCPNEMKAIDAKLNSTKDVSPETVTKVKALRADGEKFHKEGKHTESMQSLGEAKKLLGI